MKTEFKPKSKNFKKKVEESFERQKFMSFINAKLVDVKPGYCEIQVPYHSNLTQQHDFFHAGIVGTIADNAAGYAAFSLMAENSSVLTVEYKINLVAPAKGEFLLGKAKVIKNGRTLTICQSEVFACEKKTQKLCAIAQVTIMDMTETIDEKK